MTLTVIVGNNRHLNTKLLLYAAANVPSLVIDCANCANPHKLFPKVTIEQLSKIYVVELELLYKFRDVLLRVPSIAKQKEIKTIVVTISDFLFHYQDEIENNNITEHCWELLHEIGKKYEIVAGLDYNSKQIEFAKRFADRLGDEKWGTL